MSRSKANILRLRLSGRCFFKLFRLRFRLDRVWRLLHFDFGGNTLIERVDWVRPLWRWGCWSASVPANCGIADGVTPVYQCALLLLGKGIEPSSDFRKSLRDLQGALQPTPPIVASDWPAHSPRPSRR